MAWTSYELHDALSLCEELNSPTDHRACYSGVFMENVIGGLSGLMGHVTEYLSDDPTTLATLSMRRMCRCATSIRAPA